MYYTLKEHNILTIIKIDIPQAMEVVLGIYSFRSVGREFLCTVQNFCSVGFTRYCEPKSCPSVVSFGFSAVPVVSKSPFCSSIYFPVLLECDAKKGGP